MEIIATRSSISCIFLGVTHILSSMWVFILKQIDYYGNVYKYRHMELIHSLHKCSLLYQTKSLFICIRESPRKGAEEPCEGSWAGFAAGKYSQAPDVFLFCLSVGADQEWTTLVHAWLKLRLFPLVDMWGKQRQDQTEVATDLCGNCGKTKRCHACLCMLCSPIKSHCNCLMSRACNRVGGQIWATFFSTLGQHHQQKHVQQKDVFSV